MPNRLEPCPFCEETKFIEVRLKRLFDMDFHYVYCQICGARGPMHIDKQEAIGSWNRRMEDNNGNK